MFVWEGYAFMVICFWGGDKSLLFLYILWKLAKQDDQLHNSYMGSNYRKTYIITEKMRKRIFAYNLSVKISSAGITMYLLLRDGLIHNPNNSLIH